jgi:hypothetical protein
MSANIHPATTTNVQPSGPERIPFGERLTCSVNDATKASGLSRSMIYNKMKSGEMYQVYAGSTFRVACSCATDPGCSSAFLPSSMSTVIFRPRAAHRKRHHLSAPALSFRLEFG